MNFKFRTIGLFFIASLFILFPLRTYSILSHQKIGLLQESSSPLPLKLLKDIHNFQTTFDDYSLGGMVYEPVE